MVKWCVALAPWPLPWYADNAYVIADDPIKLQTRCCALSESVLEYGIPFSAASLEVLPCNGDDRDITLQDGIYFVPTELLVVRGVAVDSKGRAAVAITAQEQAATGVLFRHGRWLTCRGVPLRRNTCTPG